MGDIRDSTAELPVAADGAGVTAFRTKKSFPPAPLLNFNVRQQEGVSPEARTDYHLGIGELVERKYLQ
jgi:hypothetical protein